jgi:hypothetical protein
MRGMYVEWNVLCVEVQVRRMNCGKVGCGCWRHGNYLGIVLVASSIIDKGDRCSIWHEDVEFGHISSSE